MDLDFIPIAIERYDLCILPELMAPGQLESILAAITSPQFKARAREFGGYEFEQTGQILYEQNRA
jgi:putative molybdopterin biosynthesis protein